MVSSEIIKQQFQRNGIMEKLTSYLKSKVFFTHLLIAIGLVFILLFLTYNWLSGYTNHGETVTVPDLKGKTMKDIEKFLVGKTFQVKIADSSSFILDKAPGTIIEQDPMANSKVKEGRTIYITITRTVPPGVKLPNLVDVSQRQAEAILGSFGLKVGQLIYKPDLAKNAVLAMLFKGNPIKAGEEIPKGSAIDLILGDGIGNTEVPVPTLVGLTTEEALFVLQGSQLNPGAMVYDEDVLDSASAVIYKQTPEPGDSIFVKQGESIDLYFSK